MSESRHSSHRAHAGGAREVSWLELFYDLVFVAAIVTFSDAVNHDPDLDVIVTVIPVFAAVWWIWISTTFVINRFREDDGLERGLVLVQMLVLTLLSLSVGDGLDAHEGFVSVLYALLCADVAVMHARHVHTPGRRGEIARARRNEFAIATAPLLAAGLVEGPARYVLWGIALFIIVYPALVHLRAPADTEVPVDEPHLTERLGLLTIIVCGESFVKVALLASQGSLEDLEIDVLATLFVLVFAMWWAYFDDIPEAGLPRTAGGLRLWLFGQFWFQVFVVGIAVGYARLLPVELGKAVDDDRVLITAGPIAGAFLALALLGTCTRRVPVRPLLTARLVSVAVIALVGVAIARFDWIGVEFAAVLLALVSLAAAAVCDRLRRRTRVLVR